MYCWIYSSLCVTTTTISSPAANDDASATLNVFAPTGTRESVIETEACGHTLEFKHLLDSVSLLRVILHKCSLRM